VRQGFWNGLVAGGLMGVVLGALFAPQIKDTTAHRVIEGGRRMGRRARQLWSRGRERAEDVVEEMKD